MFDIWCLIFSGCSYRKQRLPSAGCSWPLSGHWQDLISQLYIIKVLRSLLVITVCSAVSTWEWSARVTLGPDNKHIVQGCRDQLLQLSSHSKSMFKAFLPWKIVRETYLFRYDIKKQIFIFNNKWLYIAFMTFIIFDLLCSFKKYSLEIYCT